MSWLKTYVPKMRRGKKLEEKKKQKSSRRRTEGVGRKGRGLVLAVFSVQCSITGVQTIVFVLRLWYDPKTRKTFNTPGVDIKVSGFGGTDSVEFLDPNPVSHFSSSCK